MFSLFLLASGTVWHRELLHFWRERSRVMGFLAFPVLFWAVVGSGFGDLGQFFAGSLLLNVMFTAVFSTMSVIDDRKEGFLLSMLVSPAPRAAIVAGKVVGGATAAVVQGLLFCLFLPFSGLPWPFSQLLGALLALLLTGAAFTSIGFWLAWRSRTSQGFHAIMNIVLMPLWMVSGALFTTKTASGWIRAVMEWNPVTYFLALLERTLGHGENWQGPSLMAATLVTAAVTLFFLLSAIRDVERRPLGGPAA